MLRLLSNEVPSCLCRYFLSILTSHVKKTVPELETALQKVHQLRGDRAGCGSAAAFLGR